MLPVNVIVKPLNDWDEHFLSCWATHPHYARDLIWAPKKYPCTTLALATESMPLLPSLPDYEFVNSAALKTIEKYPHLFKIVMPIKVSHFEQLLTSHPNKPLVELVSCSLQEGCWPWADTSDPSYPVTWDNSNRPLKSKAHAAFV
ncbi:hypothetical protein BDQ12DRAFT_606531 [Crucibulum laeve]|uniref:Uncharacterized protein n=1 Tax=Crucibulum laeve TaxID=68775 RepID=A0A5C3LZD5_9AGAR|nr:hypothetical protein BDQ12DRAFT_606531 [Crucibulum laeve]